jgi:hypothetical protein
MGRTKLHSIGTDLFHLQASEGDCTSRIALKKRIV